MSEFSEPREPNLDGWFISGLAENKRVFLSHQRRLEAGCERERRPANTQVEANFRRWRARADLHLLKGKTGLKCD